MSALARLATSQRASSSSTAVAPEPFEETSVSPVRVRTTLAPSASSSRLSSRLTRSVTDFSIMPVGPIAPESLPPCPGSMAIRRPFIPVIADKSRSSRSESCSSSSTSLSFSDAGGCTGTGFFASCTGFAGFPPAGGLPKSMTMRGFSPVREKRRQPPLPTEVSTTMRTVVASNCATRTAETSGESTAVFFFASGAIHAFCKSSTIRVGFDRTLCLYDMGRSESTTMRTLPSALPMRTPVTFVSSFA